MNRRTFLAALIASPALGAVVVACGDPSTVEPYDQPSAPAPTAPAPAETSAGSTQTIDHPTGADAVILRLRYEGGFVPAGTAFVNVPALLITGDGTVFRPGVQTMIFPGPLLPPITSASITEEGVQRILTLAADNGLLASPPDYSTASLVADAPDTVVTISATGQTFLHAAPALGMATRDDGSPAEETSDARRRLHTFVEAISDIATVAGPGAVGPETMIEDGTFRLQARPTTLAEFTGQDPQPTVVPWPGGTDVALADSQECATTTSPEVIAALQAATSTTLFSEGDGLFQVAAVAQLPGDPAC